MYPDQSPQPPQNQSPFSSDYLDQIAAPTKQPGMSNKLFLGILIGAIIIVIILIVAMFTAGSSTKAISTERLGLKLTTLQTVSEDAHKNIKSSELRAINSRLTTQLTNANRDIVAPLEAADIDLKKVDKELIAEEDGETLKASLEDARLNGTFDRMYATEMSYQLETTTILMSNLHESTKRKSLKEFLEPSYKDLAAIQKEFKTYSAQSN